MLVRWKPVKNHVNQVEGGRNRESTSVAEMGVTAPENKRERGDHTEGFGLDMSRGVCELAGDRTTATPRLAAR